MLGVGHSALLWGMNAHPLQPDGSKRTQVCPSAASRTPEEPRPLISAEIKGQGKIVPKLLEERARQLWTQEEMGRVAKALALGMHGEHH